MISTPFLTLIEREATRFFRLINQTVAPPLITTLMFIMIFGYSLGSHINFIEGFPYIVFIIPGLIQMSVINNAYANSSTSLFVSRMERSIENILVAPLTNYQIVTSYMLGGLMRGIVVGSAILIVASIFVPLPFAHPWIIFVDFILTSIFFSGLGILSALFAESWEKIAIFTNFVITPLTYLGGVFYSIKMLPPFWYNISHLNPIFFSVDLVRYGFLGVSDISYKYSLAIMAALAIWVYCFCVYLFSKGYKLIR